MVAERLVAERLLAERPGIGGVGWVGDIPTTYIKLAGAGSIIGNLFMC